MVNTYTKTTNTDDCFNFNSLAPGGSCSFYTLALNSANPTTQTEFKVPISYSILQTGLPTDKPNALAVWQCPPVDITNPASGYDCSNAKKPGFANQFITYHLNPTPTLVPNPDLPRSADGRWVYTCGGMLGRNCNKYQINYDSTTNTLTYAESPAYSFNLKRTLTVGGDPIQYITYNGSNSFYVGYDSTGIWSIFNSGNPGLDYDAADLIWAQFNVNNVVGLDNSFWVQPDGGNYTASVYNPMTDRFISSNFTKDNSFGALGVFAVAKDGTVISGKLSSSILCSRTTGLPTDYVSIPLRNYVKPDEYSNIFSMSSGVYIFMNVPDLVDGLGASTSFGAWYKIHTENGLCEVRPDDYMFASVQTYGDYSMVYSTQNADPYITKTSNVFTGL